MRAGSPDNCGGDECVARCRCGKAVASTGPSLSEDDRCDRPMTVLWDIGGDINLLNDSEDPRKTHTECELGSYDSKNRMEAGGAVGCRGVAKLRTAPNNSNPAAMLDVADGSLTQPSLLITEGMVLL